MNIVIRTSCHIYVPLHARYPLDAVKELAHVLAVRTYELLPGITSLEGLRCLRRCSEKN
jgi:hypothetical protein